MTEDDLLKLYDYIAEQAFLPREAGEGDHAKHGGGGAGDYIARIEALCLSLRHAPLRGTPPRDDIKPGLRVIGFERRAAIAFRVVRSEVVIVRIFYGGRDYERILRSVPEM